MKRISKTISNIKGLEKDTLEGIKYTLFFFIVIDIFAFYWWMNWKQFGIAGLMVCIVALVVILLLERRLPMGEKKEEPKEEAKEEPKEEKKESEEKPKEESKGFMSMDLGLPSADEFNDRLEKAIGL